MANSNANSSFKRNEVKAVVTVRSPCSEKENWNQLTSLLACARHFLLILTKILQFRHNTRDTDEEWER